MIVHDTVHFKGANIYVGGISYTYKSLLIFLLTEDKLHAENITVYLEIYENPFSQLSNQTFAYKDKWQLSKTCNLTLRGKESEGTESSP